MRRAFLAGRPQPAGPRTPKQKASWQFAGSVAVIETAGRQSVVVSRPDEVLAAANFGGARACGSTLRRFQSNNRVPEAGTFSASAPATSTLQRERRPVFLPERGPGWRAPRPG